MSYSFAVRAANAEAAKEAIEAEFDKVVDAQGVHSLDREPANEAVDRFVELIDESLAEDKDYLVHVYGSISTVEGDVVGGTFSVNVSLADKAVEQPTEEAEEEADVEKPEEQAVEGSPPDVHA